MERKVNNQVQAEVVETFSIGGVQTVDKNIGFGEVSSVVDSEHPDVMGSFQLENNHDGLMSHNLFPSLKSQQQQRGSSSATAQARGDSHRDLPCDPTISDHVEGAHQNRAHRSHRVPGRDTSLQLDDGGTQNTLGRAQGGEWVGQQEPPCQDRTAGVDDQAQQGRHQEGLPPGILPGLSGPQDLWLRDHRPAEAGRDGKDLHDCQATSLRWRGVWSPRQPDLRRASSCSAGVLQMGDDHGSGRWMQLPPESPCPLVGDGGHCWPKEASAKGFASEEQSPVQSQSQPIAMMTTMMHTIESLKEEVEHLKEGKPHKKATGGVITPREEGI